MTPEPWALSLCKLLNSLLLLIFGFWNTSVCIDRNTPAFSAVSHLWLVLYQTAFNGFETKLPRDLFTLRCSGWWYLACCMWDYAKSIGGYLSSGYWDNWWLQTVWLENMAKTTQGKCLLCVTEEKRSCDGPPGRSGVTLISADQRLLYEDDDERCRVWCQAGNVLAVVALMWWDQTTGIFFVIYCRNWKYFSTSLWLYSNFSWSLWYSASWYSKLDTYNIRLAQLFNRFVLGSSHFHRILMSWVFLFWQKKFNWDYFNVCIHNSTCPTNYPAVIEARVSLGSTTRMYRESFWWGGMMCLVTEQWLLKFWKVSMLIFFFSLF